MPTYDYLCDNCGHTFEKFQQMSASPLKKCPQCSKMKLKRLIGTGAGIIFKGSGFYETDYRSDSYVKGKNAASASNSAASSTSTASSSSEKSSDSSSTKTESKKTTNSDKPAKKKTSSKSTDKKSA